MINPDPQQQVAEDVVDEAAGAQQDQAKRDALNISNQDSAAPAIANLLSNRNLVLVRVY